MSSELEEFFQEEKSEVKPDIMSPVNTGIGVNYTPKEINKEYKCHWPGCNFKTTNRSEIELHHISPRELGTRLNSHVTLSFCPTHHRMIYHPECKYGHHSIKAENKLIIHHIYPTAPEGYAVEFENMRGYTWFECFTGTYANKEELNDV